MSFATMTVLSGAMRIADLSSAFALDLTKRISQVTGQDAAQAAENLEVAEAGVDKALQLRKLETALAGTVDYMAEKHGEQAARAMIGIVYKRIGGNEISEQTLGEAFLDVTRFIDKNFGTDAGDKFMVHLNGSLNASMNEFFDNGLNETFMVAPALTGTGGTGNIADMVSALSEQYTKTIKEMLEEARANPGPQPPAAYGDPQNKSALIGIMKDILV